MQGKVCDEQDSNQKQRRSLKSDFYPASSALLQLLNYWGKEHADAFYLQNTEGFPSPKAVPKPFLPPAQPGEQQLQRLSSCQSQFGESPLIQLLSRSQAGCRSLTEVAGAPFTLCPACGGQTPIPQQHFQSKFPLSLPWVNSVQVTSLQDRNKKKQNTTHTPNKT